MKKIYKLTSVLLCAILACTNLESMSVFASVDTEISAQSTGTEKKAEYQVDDFVQEIVADDGKGNFSINIGIKSSNLEHTRAVRKIRTVISSTDNSTDSVTYEASSIQNDIATVVVHAEELQKLNTNKFQIRTRIILGESDKAIESSEEIFKESRIVSQDELISESTDINQAGEVLSSDILLEDIEIEEAINVDEEKKPEDIVSDSNENDGSKNSVESSSDFYDSAELDKEHINQTEAIPKEENVTKDKNEKNNEENNVIDDYSISTYAVAKSIIVSELDERTGSFTIIISGIDSAEGIKHVQVPIWCHDSQDDLVWYDAVKQDDQYVVKSNISAHQYHTGQYHVNVYVTDNKDIRTYAGDKRFDVNIEAQKLQIEAQGNNENAFQAQLTGLSSYGCVEQILFAVWGDKNGQNDLQWYTADQIQDTYVKSILVSNHMETGMYHVDCYSLTKEGSMKFLNRDTFEVTPPKLKQVDAKVTSAATGEFSITVEKVSSPAGIREVLVPVWSKSDQSDLIWYSAVKSGDNYVINSDISKHGNSLGIYSINVYVIDGNGIMTGLSAALLNLTPRVEMFSVEKTNDSQKSYTISAKNVEQYGESSEILFAVWSEAGGQDDLNWYSGEKQGLDFSRTINVSSFKNAGLFQVHCYLVSAD